MIVTAAPLIVVLPPLSEVTVQSPPLMPLKSQPEGIGVSVIVYEVNVFMSLNTLVFDAVPSSTREKLLRGAGLAVKENEVEPFGVASLTIVIEPGKMTAPAWSWNCPPPWPATPLSNEPVQAT